MDKDNNILNIKQLANECRDNGLSVIPTKDKRPYDPGAYKELLKWKKYQKALPTNEEINSFDLSYGIGFVCGSVSGNLECLDFDNHFGNADEIIHDFFYLLNDEELKTSLVIEKTISGGYHVVYRIRDTKPPGNTKLALKAKENGDPDNLIETRGQNGYFVGDPTPGYKLMQGDFTNIPVITKEQRDNLISLCKSFNEYEKPDSNISEESKIVKIDGFKRPGDDFNESGDITPILQKHGWKLLYTHNNVEYWQRPGKSGSGISATFNKIPDKLYVFSTSTVFQNEKPYNKFQVYSLLECNNDFKKSAKELRKQGFGDPIKEKQKQDNRPLEEKFGIISFSDLMDKEFPDPIYYVNDLISEGLTLFAGDPKIGKSFFCLQLAFCVSSGSDFLNLPTNESRVLYLNLEDGLMKLQLRLKKFLYSGDSVYSQIPDKLFFGDSFPETHSIEESITEIDKLRRKYKPDLIILDTLSYIYPENVKKTNIYYFEKSLMSKLQIFARENRIGLLLVHHTNKNSKDFNSSFSGSNGLTGGSDNNMKIYETTKGIVLSTKGKIIPNKNFIISKNDSGIWTNNGNYIEALATEMQNEIIDFLQDNGYTSLTDLSKALNRNKGTVLKNLQKMSVYGIRQDINSKKWYVKDYESSNIYGNLETKPS